MSVAWAQTGCFAVRQTYHAYETEKDNADILLLRLLILVTTTERKIWRMCSTFLVPIGFKLVMDSRRVVDEVEPHLCNFSNEVEQHLRSFLKESRSIATTSSLYKSVPLSVWCLHLLMLCLWLLVLCPRRVVDEVEPHLCNF
mmetsp:Transcript_31245/g.77912  ORF Transcript_31245/g.77912 Transcript_31245/m.77912 type:complete len:142 (-) Transcript_31245:593-1018(-)